MKLLVVTIVHDPEDARIRFRQIRALREAGHEVVLAAPFSGYGRERPTDLRTIDLPRAHGRRRLAALVAARRVVRREVARTDVVLLHDPELLAAVAFLPAPHRLRVVWDVHEDTAAALSMKSWIPRWSRPAIRLAVRSVERWADRHLHLLLAEESYARRFGRRHPIVRNSPVVPAEVPEDPVDGHVIYVGALTHARGTKEMIKLGCALAPLGIAVRIVGSASGRVATDLRAAERRGAIVWHGFLPNDDALRLMERSLAGLSLLHDEPNYAGSLPTKVLEYMAHGLPVVTTPNPASVAVVDQHKCGFVVPFGDVDSAAAAIRTLRDDAVLRREMAVAGHRAVLEHYSWNRDKLDFVDVLQEWVDGRPSVDDVRGQELRTPAPPADR